MMRRRHDRAPRPASLFLLLATLAATACDDAGPAGPTERSPPTETAVVLNSVDLSLTVFPVDDPAAAFTVGLGPDGSPVTLAVRGPVAAVPMGTVPALAVVDLARGVLVRTVALPPGSGATGVAFVNDSIAVVANSSLDTVTPVNVLRGTTGAEIPVGRLPQAVTAVGDTAFVLNGELDENFQPTGPATVSVLTGSPLQVVATVTLTGNNAIAATQGASGDLWVVQAGTFGGDTGRLSRIELSTLAEAVSHAGFGDFPGAIAASADGRIFIGAFSYGIAVWDPATASFEWAPADALAPGGIASTSGLGFDSEGRLHALVPDCQAPSTAVVFGTDLQQTGTVPVGTCPLAIAFSMVPPP